jgi:hypothetical protein
VAWGFSTDAEEYARAAEALLLASSKENTVFLTVLDEIARKGLDQRECLPCLALADCSPGADGGARGGRAGRKAKLVLLRLN